MGCSPPGCSVRGDSPDQNPGVGCHALLQEIFQIQELNPGLLHYRQDSLPSEPPGKPKAHKDVEVLYHKLDLIQSPF